MAGQLMTNMREIETMADDTPWSVVIGCALAATVICYVSAVKIKIMDNDAAPRVTLYQVPHPPQQYQGAYAGIVSFTANPDEACAAIMGDVSPDAYMACYTQADRIIHMPLPCAHEFNGERYADLMCHEVGHPLGWRHAKPRPAWHPPMQ